MRKNCRFCESKIRDVFDLGDFYSCGIFMLPGSNEPKIGRLKLSICESCNLVQLSQNYDQLELYTDSYGYQSGIIESMVNHLKEIAREINSHLPGNKQLVKHLDIGSNDATLLNQVRSLSLSLRSEQNLSQLGIDPTARKFSKNYSKVNLIDKIFDETLALQIEDKFDFITSIARDSLNLT